MARRWSATAVKLTLVITAVALLLWRSPIQPLVTHTERLSSLQAPPSRSSAPYSTSSSPSSSLSSFSASSFPDSEFSALSDATSAGSHRRLLSSSHVVELPATDIPQTVRLPVRLDERQETSASSPYNVTAFPAAFSPPPKRTISALLPRDPAPGNCSARIHGSPAEKCAAVRAESACRSGAQVEYLDFYYCTCGESSVLGVALLLTWLAALIFLLGNVAADFFCPSLEELADLLRLPPTVAGVTLLPLGNGAPDVFASVVAFIGKGHQSLVGFNGVLGAACFVSTVVAGSVCLVAASKAPRARLDRLSFIRDLTFFLVAVAALCVVVQQRTIHLPHALLFLAIYPAYCVAVALSQCLPTGARIRPFLRSVSQATLPHWLWTHERSLFHARLHTHHYLNPQHYLPFLLSREPSANGGAPPGHVEAEDVTAGSCSVVLPPRLLSPAPSSLPPFSTPAPVLHSAASDAYAAAADAAAAAGDDADVDGDCDGNFASASTYAGAGAAAGAGSGGTAAAAGARGSGNRITDELREPLWGYDEQMEDPEIQPWTVSGFCEYFIKFPLTLPLLCSIPVHHKDEWSKPFATASSLLAPLLFTCFIFGPDSSLLVFSLAAALGLVLAALTWYTTDEECPPQSFLPSFLWVTAGFAMSVVWFYALANELVALLISLGVILGISPPILALTVLAWGNSVGDLVANLAFASSGDESRLQIAWSGCFAGPLFNTLVGLGLSLLLACWSRYPEPYVVPFDATLLSTLAFLLLVLLFVLLRLGFCGSAVAAEGDGSGSGRSGRVRVVVDADGNVRSRDSIGGSAGRSSSARRVGAAVVLDKGTGIVLVAAYFVFLTARLLVVVGVFPPLRGAAIL